MCSMSALNNECILPSRLLDGWRFDCVLESSLLSSSILYLLSPNNDLWSEAKVAQFCLTLCHPMDYTVYGILQCVAFPFSKRSSQPRVWTQVSCIASRFFTSWTTGKPKNTGVGSLSLLQGILPTQESNRDLLHCRWILHHLSYQGSPKGLNVFNNKELTTSWGSQFHL